MLPRRLSRILKMRTVLKNNTTTVHWLKLIKISNLQKHLGKFCKLIIRLLVKLFKTIEV